MSIFRALRKVWPFGFAQVSGKSMAPTFNDGDVILVRWFSESPTDLPLLSIVLIEREVMPGVIFIKRIQKSHGGSYWVEGDNKDPLLEDSMNDSRKWGYLAAHEIRGRVVKRIKKRTKY